MTESLIEKVRLKRELAEAAKEKRELARSKKLAEERSRARARAKERDRAIREQQERKLALAIKRRDAERTKKLAVRKTLANCLVEAYKGNLYLAVDSASRKYRREFIALGFSYENWSVPIPELIPRKEKLAEMERQIEQFAVQLKDSEQKLTDYLEIFSSSTIEHTDGRQSDVQSRLERFSQRLVELEGCRDEIEESDESDRSEMSLLLTGSTEQVRAYYGLRSWSDALIAEFRQGHIRALTNDNSIKATYKNSSTQVKEFIRSANRLCKEYAISLKARNSLREALAGPKETSILVLSWKRKPTKSDSFSDDYRKLYWIVKGEGRVVFQDILDRVLQFALKSQIDISYKEMDDGSSKLRIGRTTYELPEFISESDIAKRLQYEQLDISVSADSGQWSAITISW
jgi:hypothetical protein